MDHMEKFGGEGLCALLRLDSKMGMKVGSLMTGGRLWLDVRL